MSLKTYLHHSIKKITIFDWVIITFALFGIGVLATVLFRKADYKTITVKVGENDVVYLKNAPQKWFANIYSVGMKEIDGLGAPQAEILAIRSYDSNANYRWNENAYKKNIYLTLRVKVVYNKSSNQYLFKGKPLAIGSTVLVYPGQIQTEGLITEIEGIPNNKTKKTITLETQLIDETAVYPFTSGVREHLANAIQEGIEIMDDQGEIKAKIMEVSKQDAKQVVTSSDGSVLLTTNPLRKDVKITVQVYGYEQKGTLFMYDDIPLVIDAIIPLHLPYIDIYPTITKVLKVT